MEHLGSAFVALAIVLVVAIAAFSFEPTNPLAPWLKLIENYGTARRPTQISYVDEEVTFGGPKGALKSLAIAAKFDGTIDDFGLWIIYKGPLPDEVPTAIKVPGTHIRYRGAKGGRQLFELFAEPPVRVALRGDFGEELSQRCQPAAS